MRLPITVVILTFNEERNLPACLDTVSAWAQDVFVVDSGSVDGTLAIARASDARIVTHPFETHARQWDWALRHLPIATDWVLGLDADQRVTPELRDEIQAAISPGTSRGGMNGYFVARRQIFRGKWIRHGGYYPKYLLKIFRLQHASVDADDLVDHHFVVSGATGKLGGDLIEDNQNEAAIAVWTAKHNRYAALQAQQEFEAAVTPASVGFRSIFESPDARTRWLKQLWARLPLYVRPCLYFGYRYFLRLGFLDGKDGFIFHVLQAFWYRLLVDINLDELRSTHPAREPARVTARTAPAAERPVDEMKPV
ncbi:MAG TPA: glycosyltransferase family 2 protein [Vicinamibacterales bacterium]|nr:glycosyltransferase family 2 protein [Vicinamibacterales bacterium]